MKISDLIKKALKHDEDVERIDEQLETITNETVINNSIVFYNTNDIDNKVQICRDNKKTFFVPKNTILTLNKTIDLRYIDVVIEGQIVLTHNGVGIIVGNNSSNGDARQIYINKIKQSNYTDGDITIRVVGLKNGNVTIMETDTVQLYADGGDMSMSSISYSKFYIGGCKKLLLYGESATNFSWITENIFFGGRITELLEIRGTNYAHNNNTFYKPCIEGATLNLVKATRNVFKDVRTEGNCTINIDADSFVNYFNNNYFNQYQLKPTTIVNDNGFGNIITTNVLDNLIETPIQIISSKTFKNGQCAYKIAEPSKFTVNGDVINYPVWAYAIQDEIIELKSIQRMRVESESASFRITVQMLDDSKNIITDKNMVTITNGTWDSTNNYWTNGSNISYSDISVLNKTIKYIKLTVRMGNIASNFKRLKTSVYTNSINKSDAEELLVSFKS